MKIAVIGAGIGGLATALRLNLQGHDVHVFEANSYPGGKLTAFEQDGYRFDAGPSLFTMPFLVDELFKDAGEEPSTHFSYSQLEVVCHYFFEDNTSFDAYFDKNRLAEEIQNKLNLNPKPVLDMLNYSAFLYEHTAKLFMMRSLHQLKNYFKKDVGAALFNVHKLSLTKSMNEVNEQRLKEPKLVQLFNRFATYNGSNPYKAPGVMSIIPHLEHNQGAFFPKGGMHQITLSIAQFAEKRGVHFHFNSPVNRIQVENKQVKGIETNTGIQDFDAVVSNMDVVPTYRKLMPNQKAPEATLKQERSSSALIFYWGIKKEFNQLGVHNIFFSEDYKEEFELLFEQKNVCNDPTIYINITSKEEKEDAPKGCENWFVMVNVPSDTGQNWDEIIARTRANVIQKLSRMLKTEIEPLIETENMLNPKLIEAKTSSFGGALYGAASNDRMAAFLRHPNFSPRIKNLFFVGGSVHPGGGIPLCLLSAKITAELVKEKAYA